MTLVAEDYAPSNKAAWDALVGSARNALFIHRRDYMDYHADRFEDCSIVVRDGGRVVAALPASIDRPSGHVVSHAGLTFGGLLLHKALRGTDALSALDAAIDRLRERGGVRLTVRLLPGILQAYPSAEIDYGLWRRGFELVRRDLSSALPLDDALPFNRSKTQAVAAASKAGVMVGAGEVAPFHALLADVLRARHEVDPVHRLDELERLVGAFPDHMLVRTARRDGALLAGALIYRYGAAWHTQYLASSEEGRAVGALDAVIASVIDEARSDGAQWLSFGTSTTEAGRALNEGLLWQKESFGARSVVHDVLEGPL